MMFDFHHQTGNKLLDATAFDDIASLAPHLEWVDHALRDRINVPGEPAEFAYFPAGGLFSVIALYDRDDQVEGGTVGNEGFIGMSTFLRASHTPNLIVCQASGRSLRMSSTKLIELSTSVPRFGELLMRYIHIFTVQLTSTILANSSYLIAERLARWILMCGDRLDSHHFEMTHEFIALMLAVRRPGVTEAIHDLEGRHLIRATRGHVEITNRDGLVQLAGGSYGQAEREHARLIIPADRSPSLH